MFFYIGLALGNTFFALNCFLSSLNLQRVLFKESLEALILDKSEEKFASAGNYKALIL